MSGAAAKQPPGAGSADKAAAAAAGDSVPEPPPPSLLSVDVTGLVSQFARSFVLIFPVYVLGYLGLSFSWVLIALCGLFWIRRHRGGKTSRLGRALAFLEDEEEAVRLSVSSADLPAWVSAQQRPSALPREQPSPAAGLGPGTSVVAAASSSPGRGARARCRPVAGREKARSCRPWGARPRSASLPRDPGPSLRRGGLAPPPPPGPLAPEAAALPCPDRRRGPGFPRRNKLYLRLWVTFLLFYIFFSSIGWQRRPRLGRREVSAISCDWGKRFFS